MRREAQAMARVSHENAVHVYEVGEIGGQIFIAMEFVDGTTRTAWQRQRNRTWQELLGIYRQAALGLDAAHQTGLVHRDFKPDNVLVDRTGRARVADFGLARLQGDATVSSEVSLQSPQSALQSPITRDGVIAGTPGYMSPEQARGAAVDARSDQFSFCVALYEALYRQAPFASEDPIVALNPGKPLPPPPDSPVPAEIFTALGKGMASEAAARFSSMAELITALTPDGTREGAAAAALRRWFTMIGLPLVLLCCLALGLKNQHSALKLEDLTKVSIFLFVSLALLAFFARHRLRTNPMHRGMLIRGLCFVATSALTRCIGVYLHLDITHFVPIDLAAAGGLITSFAYPLLTPMWAVAAGFELAAAAAARWPQYCVPIANLAYTVLGCGIYYAWAWAARGARAGRTIV